MTQHTERARWAVRHRREERKPVEPAAVAAAMPGLSFPDEATAARIPGLTSNVKNGADQREGLASARRSSATSASVFSLPLSRAAPRTSGASVARSSARSRWALSLYSLSVAG